MFTTRERRVWMRLDNHAVVWDREPDFKRLCRDQRGTVLRILRIWYAGAGRDRSIFQAYLGSVRFGTSWPRRAELSRLMRRAGACAHLAGESPRLFRRRVKDLLRRKLRTT